MTYAVFNADDRSHAVDSRLVWSIARATDLTFGVQHSAGAAGSEFAALPNAVQVQLQWFFNPPLR